MQSMDEIYQTYAKMVFKYLMTMTHNEDISEELTQETFYQAVRCIHKYDESCKVSTWLCAIAKNQYLSYLRKHPIEEDIDQVLKSTDSIETELLCEERRIELMKKLHLCQEPFREILYLRIFGNLSFKEIGEIMGKTENWARVNFYRGKEKLRKEIAENE